MKSETQCGADLARLCKLIESMPFATLTTLDDDGDLVSRSISPLELDSHGALWVLTDLRSAKVDHPRSVNLSFADPSQSNYAWLSGRAEFGVHRDHEERGRAPTTWRWAPYPARQTALTVLKVLPDTADFWDSSASRMFHVFAIAASVAAYRRLLPHHQHQDRNHRRFEVPVGAAHALVAA